MIASRGRIWEAAGKDESRPVLTGVHFDAEAATLTASDSFVAARVSCEVEEGDESGLIPAAALKEAAGRSLRIAGGKATLSLPDGERAWTLLEGQFPDVEKVGLTLEVEKEGAVGLNAAFLARLANALGCDAKNNYAIWLRPSAARKPIPVGSNVGGGIIMPVVIAGSSPPVAPPPEPDLADDAVVLAGVDAAIAKLHARKGRRAAAAAFRAAIRPTTAETTATAVVSEKSA